DDDDEGGDDDEDSGDDDEDGGDDDEDGGGGDDEATDEATADRRTPREIAAADWDQLEALAQTVNDLTPIPLPPNRRQIFDDGPAALARVFADAAAHLARGHARAALVCATDSLLERPVLSWLLGAERLKGPDVATGLIPGEAAAFLLLEPA